MKVLIINNMAPFLWGGAEELAVNLSKNLQLHGHEAEILRIPFQWEPAEKIPSQMLLVEGLELWNADRVICLKFPAYLIRHPRKIIWLLHQYRQAYDLLDVGQTNIPGTAVGTEIRNLIVGADNLAFGEARKIFTNSAVTQARLKKYNGYDSEVLLPPVNDGHLFVGGVGAGYVFAGGRINSMKRQHLLLEALAKTQAGVKMVIAGPPDSSEDVQRLNSLVVRYSLQDRVILDMRFLPRQDYANYLNAANAVAYLPFDEDSLGYVAMEAALAEKPLISASDSGGILGLAVDGESGWVCSPDVDSIAQALDKASIWSDETVAKGKAAKRLWDRMNINWPATIERLLS